MRQIVAGVVLHQEHYCLLRRSEAVSNDTGLWHCVTGFLETDVEPVEQIELELYEELGAVPDQFALRFVGSVDIEGWNVHVFAVQLKGRSVQINWEHDAYDWVLKEDMGSYSTVWWLRDLIDIAAA